MPSENAYKDHYLTNFAKDGPMAQQFVADLIAPPVLVSGKKFKYLDFTQQPGSPSINLTDGPVAWQFLSGSEQYMNGVIVASRFETTGDGTNVGVFDPDVRGEGASFFRNGKRTLSFV